MPEPTEQEVQGMMAAGEAAGAYLDKLGKTDLAALSWEEWMGHIEAAITAFQDSMAASYHPYALVRSADDPIPANAPITDDDCPY